MFYIYVMEVTVDAIARVALSFAAKLWCAKLNYCCELN